MAKTAQGLHNQFIRLADKATDDYGKKLSSVLRDLERRVAKVIISARKPGPDDVFDAAVILNARPELLKAIADSGYTDLALEHVKKFHDLPEMVQDYFKSAKLPPLKFSKTSVDVLDGLARADLIGFDQLAADVVDKLRTELYRQAVAGQPIEAMTDVIASAISGKLKRYAYTYANTAVLSFQGALLQEAGKAVGADEWEVVGPLDAATRDVCQAALADPIRTESEWKDYGYWGPTPGGWNCRHELYPYFGAA